MEDFSGYILVRGSEDGEPIQWLSNSTLEELLVNDPDNPSEVKKFLTLEDIEDNQETAYWKEEEAMLLKVEVAVPKPVNIVERYELDN